MIRKLILNPLINEIENLKTAATNVGGLSSNPLSDSVILLANASQEVSQPVKSVILDCLRWAPDRGSISSLDGPFWIGGGLNINRLILATLLVSVRAQQRWTASDMLAVLFVFFSEFHDDIARRTQISSSPREIVEPRTIQQPQNMYEGTLTLDIGLPINVIRTEDLDTVNSISLKLKTPSVIQENNIGT